MKCYFLILVGLIVMKSVSASESSEKLSEHTTSVLEYLTNKKITLERISVKRIMSKRAQFKSKIKRSKNFTRAFYFAGGVLTSATIVMIARYLWNNWSGHAAQDSDQEVQPLNREDVALYIQPGFQEFMRRERENRTFSGRVKNSIFDGVNFALYTFIAVVVLNLFYYAEGQSLNTIKDMLNEDELWLFRLSYSDITMNLKRLQSSTYAFIQELSYILSDTKKSSAAFIEYFNGDVVVDFASVVHAIEDLIAIISESFFELSSPSQKFEEDIDNTMNNLIEQTNAFAEYLESIINKEDGFDKDELMRNLHLLYRKFSITLTGYAADCGLLMFGKDVLHLAREGRL